MAIPYTSTWSVQGLNDLAVRAVKTAITTFVGVVGANVAGWTDLSALKAAGITAAAAAASVVLNAVLSWASAP